MSHYDKYEAVIGLEVHVQLLTKSKAFSSDATEYGASPNTQVSVITLGHPGTLPRYNKKALEFAVKIGLATNCSIRKENHWARKNYFYPDHTHSHGRRCREKHARPGSLFYFD